jgi:hypothetical protein
MQTTRHGFFNRGETMKLFQQSLPFVFVVVIVCVAAFALMNVQQKQLHDDTVAFCEFWSAGDLEPMDCESWADTALAKYNDNIGYCMDKYDYQTLEGYVCMGVAVE